MGVARGQGSGTLSDVEKRARDLADECYFKHNEIALAQAFYDIANRISSYGYETEQWNAKPVPGCRQAPWYRLSRE